MLDDLLTPGEVATSLKIGKPMLFRWIRAGTFPRPIRVGARSLRWRESDIRHWLAVVEASGLAGPGFRASDWHPPAGEPSGFERLVAATSDELAAELTAVDETS